MLRRLILLGCCHGNCYLSLKEEQFKTALLDYLKKYHNTDGEKLRMVAGKFLMYREQAKAIEEQARSLVKSLKRKKLG